MRIRVLNILLLLVFTIGILGAGSLVWKEVTQGDICPKLIGIPACYIILTCFVIPLLGHLLKWNNGIYFMFTGLAFIIAFIASIMQLTGNGDCPRTENGTPMCYYSLALFSVLFFSKIIHIRKTNAIKNL